MKQQLRDRLLKQLNDKDDAPLAHCAKFDDDKLVSIITNFIAAFPAFSARLYDLHGQVPHLGTRLGRGEVLVYFIFDDIELGGSSSSIDCFVDGKPVFEIKSAHREGEKYTNFMLGIDEVPVFYGHLKRENLKLERISGGLTRLSYIFKD
jgi:hypothetical protein